MIRKLTLFHLVPFFMLLIAAAPVFAEESSDLKGDIREITRVEVTGSRLAEDIEDVPASAYVITSQDIENSGARSTQEVLDKIPGVQGLRNSSAMVLDKNVTVRGLTSEVLLLVDGIPFMTSSYGTGISMGAPFDLRTIPLGSIERIEVVKGASSAIYGSNAAGGVINVITKKGAAQSAASISAEGGSQGWFKGTISGTAVSSDDLWVTLGYTRTLETGDIDIRNRGDGTYDKATDYRGNDYVLNAGKGRWLFTGGWGDFDSQWENTYNNDISTVYNNTQKNRYCRFALAYADDVNSGKIYYNKNEKEYSYYSDPAYVSSYDYEDSSVGVMFNRKQEFFGFAGIWGFDWRRETSKYDGYSNYGGWITNDTPYDLARNGFAPYFEVSVPVGDMGLDIGLRYEHWNVDEGETVNELIPRISLNWESPSGQLWYLTAGRFFSMPSFYQIFMPDRNYGIPNPDLKPEKGWTYDIGVKDSTAENPWSLGIFYMDMEDKIKYESDTVTWIGQYVNLDKYRAWGAEGKVRLNFNDSWSYTQGISWTHADEKTSDSDSWTRSDMPRWDVSGSLNYVNGPWSGELNAHYYADRNIDSTIYQDDDMMLVNASVSWKNGGHKVIFSCTNLFDKEYCLDSQGYITPERRFIVSWEYTF